MITAIVAFFIDAVLGDPRSNLHPVVLIGRLITSLERMLYHKTDSSVRQILSGGLLVVLVLVFTFLVVNGIMNIVRMCSNSYVIMAIEAFLLSFTISPKSLAAAGKEIHDYLVAKDLIVKFAEPVDTDEERAEMIQSAIRYAKEFVATLKESK